MAARDGAMRAACEVPLLRCTWLECQAGASLFPRSDVTACSRCGANALCPHPSFDVPTVGVVKHCEEIYSTCTATRLLTSHTSADVLDTSFTEPCSVGIVLCEKDVNEKIRYINNSGSRVTPIGCTDRTTDDARSCSQMVMAYLLLLLLPYCH